ncbi:hypothetical protein [Halorussus caseinilyticus]|uniref:Uncharacterized protein n=1 Tax=Halorussus caseinilyticus TaxID=3034025 RepID=A0ABD5WJY1_9EURY|nr:hypothetical protein [Halorussus sp. DT72]
MPFGDGPAHCAAGRATVAASVASLPTPRAGTERSTGERSARQTTGRPGRPLHGNAPDRPTDGKRSADHPPSGG